MIAPDGGVTVDARGLRCPLPVIELGRRIVEVPVGGTVRLLSDDPAASSDVPAWCEMRGHTLLATEPAETLDPDAATPATAYLVRRRS